MAIKKDKLRGKRKNWVSVLAPRLFAEKAIGESLVENSNSLIGRKLKINLMQLTSNPVHQNTLVKFKIEAVKNNSALTVIVGYGIIPTSLKRIVERNKNRIDLSFIIKTSDGVEMRLSPILITKSKVNKPLLTALRKEAINVLTKKITAQKYDAFVSELVSHKVQEFLKRSLKKVYPLKRAEIRVMKVLNS